MPLCRVRRSLLWNEYRDGYLFIAPWLLGFLLFTAGPMIASLFIAMTEWEIVTPPRWVGPGQFLRLLTDDRFYLSLYNTAYYVVLGVPTHLLLALLAALALNLPIHGVSFWRTVYYLPSVTPAVAMAIIWLWIFNTDFGLLNMLLALLGLPKIAWLQDPRVVKLAFVLMSYWTIGGQMVIFLAGLQAIPQHLYEAAAIDGAGRWARFWYITLPLLTPSIFFNLTMAIIGAFQVFTFAYIITGGGPENATLFYVLYLYRQAFERFQMGYASALAWVLFVIILLVTVLQFRTAERWVFYEGELRR
jgi:multiple sugar transport system permease protein